MLVVKQGSVGDVVPVLKMYYSCVCVCATCICEPIGRFSFPRAGGITSELPRTELGNWKPGSSAGETNVLIC